MSEASKAAERIANKTDNRCVCGGGLDLHDLHDAAILGARDLLRWARARQYIDGESECLSVTMADLEYYFAEESK